MGDATPKIPPAQPTDVNRSNSPEPRVPCTYNGRQKPVVLTALGDNEDASPEPKNRSWARGPVAACTTSPQPPAQPPAQPTDASRSNSPEPRIPNTDKDGRPMPAYLRVLRDMGNERVAGKASWARDSAVIGGTPPRPRPQ